MLPKFNITIQDFDDQFHTIGYELLDNPISKAWYRKIHHLYRIPLDRYYTRCRKSESIDVLQQSMRNDLVRLKDLIGLEYPVKETYDQTDCNTLHTITLTTQYNHTSDIREIFHRMHRTIHKIEEYLNGSNINGLSVGWGEKEGLLESKFDVLPYHAYESMKTGNIYLCWSEFGKTPYQYWRDQDTAPFFETCKPHETFRALFVLAVNDLSVEFTEEFIQWFDQYRGEWMAKYGCDWLPLYECGGMPLARPLDVFDWHKVSTVSSITPL